MHGCMRVRVYRCIHVCAWGVGVVLCWCGCEYIVPVNKKFTFDDRRTIVLRCERFRGTAFSQFQFRSVFLPFRSVFIPFCLRTSETRARYR